MIKDPAGKRQEQAEVFPGGQVRVCLQDREDSKERDFGGKRRAGIPLLKGPACGHPWARVESASCRTETCPGAGLCVCQGRGALGKAGVLGADQKVRGFSLTCTHSYCVPRAVPTVVAIEAPMGVTDGGLRAVVPKLLGTHLTALTAVCDEADPQRAAGRRGRALARPLAELGA